MADRAHNVDAFLSESFAAAAVFPPAVSGASTLLNHINKIPSQSVPTLGAPVAPADTSISLTAGTGSKLPTNNFMISIDDEIIFITTRSTDTLTVGARGAEGTTAASHLVTTSVNAFITALAHNQLAAEVAAIEAALGVNCSNFFPLGGDGSDGALIFDGVSTVAGLVPSGNTYTLTRDIFASSMTVNSGVTINTGGFAIFCTGTLTNNGTIQSIGVNGNSGSNAASSAGGNAGGLVTGVSGHYAGLTVVSASAGGAGTTTAGNIPPAVGAGGNSANPVVSGGIAGNNGTAGGAGGNGSAGNGGIRKGGSASSAPAATKQIGRTAIGAYLGSSLVGSSATNFTPFNGTGGGGTGGSGGGGDNANSGGGGGGGGSPGCAPTAMGIFAAVIVNNGTIQSNGGAGGNGGNGFSPTLGTTGGGGGGGGGNGGVGGTIWLVYKLSITNAGVIQAAGGPGGAAGQGGTGHGGGTNGQNGDVGGPGLPGIVIQIQV